MSTIIGLLLLCAAPYLGTISGEALAKKKWLSNRWRTFFASLALLAACSTLAGFGFWWTAIIALVFGFCLLRDARSYLGPSYEYYRPPLYGATRDGIDFRDRKIMPWSQKHDLWEMQEGALGSIGSPAGAKFDQYPPVIHRRQGSVRLVVNNGHFPPKGRSAPRGKLRVVK